MAGDEPKKDVTDDVQLKGDNYDEWSRSFRTAIRARKKFGFIDGTIERPGEKDKDIEDWWTINSLLVSWIRNTIEPSLCSTISHVEIAKDLWDDIKDHFFVTNGPRIQQLKSDLAGWKCVCNLGAVFEKKQEEEKVHTFLMSLDESVYGTARSNILAQDLLPNLNKVYSILIQEERVNTMMRGKDRRWLIQKGMVLEEDCRLDAGKVEAVEDRILRTVIGAGKRWDGGLFYFREKPLVQALNTTLSISVDLWHKRLGHPPLEVINFLPGVSSSRKDKVISENCEMLTTLLLMFTMMRPIMESLHKTGGDPLRTGEGSNFVPQDNVSSSSQSPGTIEMQGPFPSSSPAQSWSSGTPYPIAHYALERNGTWTIENLPKDKKALGCKWVYKIKCKSDGAVEWFKARLVILGNHQVARIDYNETFAPVEKMVTRTVNISQNLVFRERTKHIEVDCHYIRDELVSGNITAQYVSTKEQIADFFTKALGKAQFDYLLCKLGVHNLHVPT
ncbi:retrovirus-related pol polyprotein from transposon TNT 1-94 [Tanacetum coccineum]